MPIANPTTRGAAGHVVGDDPHHQLVGFLATLGEEFTGVDAALEADSHACIAISTTTNDSDRTPASP
jgi:hypothetical protein